MMNLLTTYVLLESAKIKTFFQKIAYFFIDPQNVPNTSGDLPNDSEMLEMLKHVKWDHVLYVVIAIVVLIVLGNIKSKIVAKNKAKKKASENKEDKETNE